MKKFLSLLLWLAVALPGFGQKKANPTVTISYGGQSYQVVTNVPVNTYAVSSSGKTAMETAIKNGEWTLTTLDGCVIPKGTKPPKVKPTGCSQVIDVAYNQSLAATSATGSGNTYDRAGATGNKIKDGELTYTFTGLPAPGSYTLALGYQSNTTVPTAQISVNNGAVQTMALTATNGSLASASATLTGFVSGNNLVKVTPSGYFAQDYVRLSRVGSTTVTQPPSVTTTDPPSQTTVTPASGVYAYRGDDFDYTPYADADQSNKFPIFENSNIYVSLALRNQLQGATQPGLGGGIYQVKNKQSTSPDHVLVNVPNRYIGDDNNVVDRNRTPDFLATGQGLGECLYQSPKPFYATGETGVTTSPGSTIPGTDPHLGYNPFELGDDLNNTGRLLKFGKSGSTGFYTAMGPMAYGQSRLYLGSEVLMEKWGQVQGKALMLHYQTTFSRPNFSRALDKAQEAPCLYVPGNRKFVWYDGTNPYSSDGVTEITAPVSNGGNGGGIGLNGMRNGNVFPTENWIASIGENGYGIGLVFYDNIMTSYGFYGDGGADLTNPSSGGSFAYIGWNPQEVLDYNIKWRHRVKLVVGTVSEIRQEAYNDPYRPSATPKFKFNRAGREGWIFNAGDDDNEKHTWDDGYSGNARAGWKVYFSGGGDYSASMTSPGGIWKTNQFNKLYIRYKYSGSETQMELKFQRNRQKPNSTDVNYNGSGQKYAAEEAIRYSNGGADQDGQTVKFAVTGDGQWHTAVIDFSNLPKWTGIISRFVINPHFYVGGKTYGNNEYMIFDWINSENTDPFPNN